MGSNMGHLIDLSDVQDHGLSLVLLRLPAKELLPKCALVSKQWNRILSRKTFWIDKAELEDYKLPWPILSSAIFTCNANVVKAYQSIVVKHSFNRNFIKDRWDLSITNAKCFIRDRRWKFNKRVIRSNDHHSDSAINVRIEAPPVFLNGTAEVNLDLSNQVPACLATSYHWFEKNIVIDLAAEGLTDEIMDKLRPTIVVSELVANRKDCASIYRMRTWLSNSKDGKHGRKWIYDTGVHRYQDDHMAGEGVKVSTLRFKQWEAEGWRLVEQRIKEYPVGMRYLIVQCSGKDEQFWAGYYGVKVANCSVQAICEKNAEAENDEWAKATNAKEQSSSTNK